MYEYDVWGNPIGWEPSPPPTQVYLAQAGGFIKIGASHNVERRLDALGQEFPGTRRPPEIRGIRPALVRTFECRDAFAVEAALHDAFADQRVVGEWFRINDRLRWWLERRRDRPVPGPVDLATVEF